MSGKESYLRYSPEKVNTGFCLKNNSIFWGKCFLYVLHKNLLLTDYKIVFKIERTRIIFLED